MTGEEIAGPPGAKVNRLLIFAGAGAICVFAINKWRELEQKSSIQLKEKQRLANSQSNAIQKAHK